MLKANDKLIQIECHNAEVLSTSIPWPQSDQRTQKANSVGIATIIVSCLKNHAIIVSCLKNHAQSLSANMSHLASGAKDKEMKNSVEECSQGFSSAIKELSSATIRLKKAKYDDAERSVNKALNFYNDATWACKAESVTHNYYNSSTKPKFHKNTRLVGKIIEKTSLTNFY